MRKSPWWTGYPQSVWMAVDWERWRKEGSPRLPRGIAQPPKQNLTEITPLTSSERPLVSFSGGLYSKPEEQRRNAARRKANQVLDKYGVRPRSSW